MNEYIKKSSFFTPFISIKYNEKFWPNKEIQYARSIKNKKYGFIVPIIIGERDEEKIQKILDEIGIPGIIGYLAYDELSEENIIEIVNVLSKKVEDFKKNGNAENNPKTEYPDFIPLEKEKYEEYFNKLTQIDKSYNNDFFHFTRDELIEELKTKLEDKRFVFVKGPLHVGKTELIKSFKEKYFDDYRIKKFLQTIMHQKEG